MTGDLRDDDFIAFWASEKAKHGKETKRILGVDIEVPTEMPLRLQLDLEAAGKAETLDDLRDAVTSIFGVDPLDTWIANGATTPMLKVIIAWGIANAQGTPTTFERAMELATEAEGKAVPVNRAARRASSRTQPSGKAGRSSSPTSAASTASRRAR